MAAFLIEDNGRASVGNGAPPEMAERRRGQ
jgi:hypothetical protein